MEGLEKLATTNGVWSDELNENWIRTLFFLLGHHRNHL